MKVVRSRQGGHDRLYVTDGEALIGYVDIDTGERKMDAPDRVGEFETAVALWLNEYDIPLGKSLRPKHPTIIAASPGY